EAGADALEDARHRLDVVREHLRLRAEHLGQLVGFGVEVRDQNLHAGTRVEPVDLADGLGVEPRAAAVEVVTRDTGDGRVAPAHPPDALGHPARLVGVELGGLTRVDLAEVAPPRALVTADEERGLAVLPALVDVRTARLFAHGVQTFAADEALEFGELRAHPGAGLDPRRLSLDRRLAVADFETQQLPTFRQRSHGTHPTP